MVATINADGSNERVLKVVDSPRATDAIDWSPDGSRIFYTGDAEDDPNIYHMIDPNTGEELSSIPKSTLERPSSGAGTVRFSPDGRQLVYARDNDSYSGANPAIINLDGTGKTILTGIDLGRGEPLWWTGGEPVPTPERLELWPDPVVVWQGKAQQVTPTLFDAAGKVIVRAATGWTIDPSNAASPTVSTTGEVVGGTGDYTFTLRASNGGLPATATVINDNTPVTGVVYTPGGIPQAGAGVALFTAPDEPPSAWAVADQVYGEYRFGGCAPGTYWLQAYPPDTALDLAPSQLVQIQIPSPQSPVIQDLYLRPVTVSGVVYQPDGATPAGQVRVMVFDAS